MDFKCFSQVSAKIHMSSMKLSTFLRPCNTMRMRRQKEAPALTKPKGMVLNWNNPLGVSKAVYGLDLLLRPNCQ